MRLSVRTLSKLLVSELTAVLVFCSSVFAQEEAAKPFHELSLVERLSSMLPMIALLFAVFYFLVFKPQNEKEKKQRGLLEGLKKGQKVVSSAGIIGRVAGIEKDYILLEIDSNTKIKVQKAHITSKYEPEQADKQ